MPALIEQLRSAGVNRTPHLVAIGGGVIQDIAAFVASIYMRGLEWSYIPTTVLAMVDSCIGGKSSINVGPYKNLVGTFHPPQPILIDPAIADSLPSRPVRLRPDRSCQDHFCRGPQSFAQLPGLRALRTMPTAALEHVILESPPREKALHRDRRVRQERTPAAELRPHLRPRPRRRFPLRHPARHRGRPRHPVLPRLPARSRPLDQHAATSPRSSSTCTP